MKKEKQHPDHSVLSNIGYTLSLLWKDHKGFVIFQLLYAAFSALRSILPVLSTQIILNLLSEGASIVRYLLWMAALAGTFLTVWLIHCWYDTSFMPIQTRKIRSDIRSRLLYCARQTEYVRFDDAKFFDLYTRCIKEGEDRCLNTLGSLCACVTAVCSLSGITAIILSLNPMMIAISLALLAARLILSVCVNRLDYRQNTANLPLERQNDYIKRVFYQKQFAKEIKIFSLDRLFLARQQRVSQGLIGVVKKYRGKRLLLSGLQTILELGTELGCYAYLGVLALMGRLSVGACVALVNATTQFIWQMNSLFGILPDLQNHAQYIDDFRKFMESGKKVPAALPAPGRFEKLELSHAKFTYEGSGFALKDLSLTIKKGEKIAIVGENGSGKSTLIRMLMNLYHPSSGEIFYNGRPYGKYDGEALHSAFGAVFQDVQSYDMTISEYILLREYTEDDEPAVWDALEKCGLANFVKGLPKGLETRISTEFDPKGTEFSGGQLQKLAIARIYAGNYDFIILDEPTAALDPRSEYQFNKTLFDIAKDKTVIFISHRLSTTRFADKIYLMDGGRIVEQGRHDDLMKIEGGRYRELFDLQAEYYRNGEAEATA